jgi:putative alpha-1,2-mannosidase
MRLMDNNTKTVVGDSIGTYFTYKFDKRETVEVKIAVSYVSITNARENLEKKQQIKHLMPFTKKLTTSGMIYFLELM